MEVLACVVTYHPGPGLERLLTGLRAQAGVVLVVDNGSPAQDAIEALARRLGCEFAGFPANRGIAAALNQGVAEARKRGARWLATFDQDSEVPAGLVAGLLEAASCHPQPQAVGVVCPSYRDLATGKDYLQTRDILAQGEGWRELRATLTSGSLVRMEVFDDAGPFDESLFIDSVDHDLCLRARRSGWRIVQATEPTMAHALGAITRHHVAGLKAATTHHAADRRYYMARNQLEVSWRYVRVDPAWAVGGLWRLLTAAAAILLFEDDRRGKLSAMAQGAMHFLARRFGPRS